MLPQEFLDRYGIEEGAHAHSTETPNGILLAKVDAHIQSVMEAGEHASVQHENAFRELATS